MALLAPFDRPLALRLLGDVDRPRSRPSPAVPTLSSPIEGTSELPEDRGTLPDLARFLAHALLTDRTHLERVLAELEASVDENVEVWSPCIATRSRTELVTALLDSDDALTDLRIAIVGTSTSDSTVYVEWRVESRFDNAGFLNDDLLIEPSGATVEATGVFVFVFRHNRATQIRCYYDGLSLLEQVVGRPAPSP